MLISSALKWCLSIKYYECYLFFSSPDKVWPLSFIRDAFFLLNPNVIHSVYEIEANEQNEGKSNFLKTNFTLLIIWSISGIIHYYSSHTQWQT